jgi:trimeric autotransporter adhesin
MENSITYAKAMNNLVNSDGALTPTGVRAMQLYNLYADSGLPPMAAAQLVGGQLLEDSSLNPLQVQCYSKGCSSYQPDSTVGDLLGTFINKSPHGDGIGDGNSGVSISQWTEPGRQIWVQNYLADNFDLSDSAFAAAGQTTMAELNLPKFANVLASLQAIDPSPTFSSDPTAKTQAAQQAQAILLQKYENPADNEVPGPNFQNRLNSGLAVYDLATGGGAQAVPFIWGGLGNVTQLNNPSSFDNLVANAQQVIQFNTPITGSAPTLSSNSFVSGSQYLSPWLSVTGHESSGPSTEDIFFNPSPIANQISSAFTSPDGVLDVTTLPELGGESAAPFGGLFFDSPEFAGSPSFSTDLNTFTAPTTAYVMPDLSQANQIASAAESQAASNWSGGDASYGYGSGWNVGYYDPGSWIGGGYDPSAAWSSYGGGGYGGGDGGDGPVVLDLTGKGISITQTTSSSTFFDMTGDGYKNQTAWAGAGNGVLFVDLSGKGVLTQANQFRFTDWDPSASSDMQALADVFDTNHDGSLNSGDADFSDFFVMETNANGTQSVYSLAQLGITSINLTANNVNENLPDGSSVDGESTFTYSNGTTGTAATVTFAYNANGNVVTTTNTANADGSTTVQNVVDNSDGQLASINILNTSSNGLTKTLTNENSGGVVTSLQTDVTTTSAGVTTEVLTNYANGAVQANGELTASGVTGDKKLNSTTTITNGATVTINRDQLGGGWTTQSEVQTFSGDALVNDVVSNLNPNGSASLVTTTATTNAGLTTTTTALVDGLAADNTTTVDATVIGVPSGSILAQRTETITTSKGTTAIGKEVIATATTANSVTATISKYLADATTLNGTSVQATTTNAGGSTTTQTDYAANGAFIDETVSTVDSTGLLKTTKTDANGGGTASAPVFTSVETDNTTVDSSGNRTETVINYGGDGATVQNETITWRAASGAARNITTYATGDGQVSQTEVVAVNAAGVTTDTTTQYAATNVFVGETVSTTSADGLWVTTQTDATGAGTASAPTFDHISVDHTVHNSDGSTTETLMNYGATTSNVIGETTTTTSGNGLSITTDQAFVASSLAAGTWDRVTTDNTVVNSDSSLTETTTTLDGHSNTLQTVVKSTSANRQTVTTTTTLGSTNLAKVVETKATQANGSVIDTSVQFDQLGDVLGATQTTTSADGLVKVFANDVQGESAATYASTGLAGLAFDQTTTDTTVINADGSKTETVNIASKNGALESQSVTTTSANGLTVTTTANPFATAAYATKTIDSAVYNADGSQTTTATDYANNGAVIDQTIKTVSASGLSVATSHNYDGAGVEQSTTDVTAINANGSQTETVTDYTGTSGGTVRDVTTTTSGIVLAGLGDESIKTTQSNGSVASYSVETVAPDSTGTEWDTTKYYASQGGAMLLEKATAVSASGLVKTTYEAVNGDTSWDFWNTDLTALNADGSRTEWVATSNKAQLLDETVTTTSANGLSKTTFIDANGATNSSGVAVFDLVTTDNTVLNANGSTTETVTSYNQNGGEIDQSVTTTSADQQTITKQSYLDETNSLTTVDQTQSTQTQANGSVVQTTVSYNASHAVVDTVTQTTSGNGLSKTTTYVNGSGTTTDSETDTTTYDSNGDGGTLVDAEHSENVNGVILSSSSKTQSSANDQYVTNTLVLSGALAASNVASFQAVASTSTTISNAGVTTKVTADTINGGSSAADTTTVVTSANGLSTTTSTALGTSTPYIVNNATTNTDGSTTTSSTYYNPSTMGSPNPTVAEQATVSKSWDGRTTTTTEKSDFDGTNYTVQTIATVDNVNGSTTSTRNGTGSWGAGTFDSVTNVLTNADASVSTVIQNYTTAGGALCGQSVSTVSGNGLATAIAIDTTGTETLTNLEATATDLINGTALPSGLLASDIIGLDAKAINADGSTTETNATYFGSLSNLRSNIVTTTSANGLVTTRKVDADGNGTFEQVDTTTAAPDGSKTEVMQYYGNAGVNAGQLTATNSLTTSADGLVSVLTLSNGATDTTTSFANANGSYQWSRVVSGTATGVSAGWSTHDIDANGIDTWSWSDASTGGTHGTITVDVATERQDIAQANTIYTTILGHAMTDSETQYLAQYIQNGVLNRTALASALIASPEYTSDYGGVPLNASGFAFQVNEDFLNVLGRLPTAGELAQFDPSSMQTANITTQTLANTAVAIAQYATDWTGNGATAALGQGFAANFAPPVEAAQKYAYVVNSSGAGSWMQLGAALTQSNVTIYLSSSSNAVITGSNDTINLVGAGATVSVNGASDIVNASGAGDVVNVSGTGMSGAADTVNISGGSVNVGVNTYAVVSGANNNVSGSSGDTLAVVGGNNTIAGGAGEDIYIQNTGTAYDTINVSNDQSNTTTAGGYTSSVNFGSNAYAVVNGNNNAIGLPSGDTLVVLGNGNSIWGSSDDDITIYNAGSTGNTVYVTNDAFGQATAGGYSSGVWVSANSFVTVSGSGNGIVANTGDTLAVSGGGNTINGGADEDIAISNTGSVADTVNVSNDVFGQATAGGNSSGVMLTSSGAIATVNGSNNGIALTAGATVTSSGGGNTINAANATANIGNSSSATVNGDGATVNVVGSGSTVTVSGNSSSVNVNGSSDAVTLNGASEHAAAAGSYDNITANGSSDGVVLNGNNASENAYIYGYSASVAINGAGEYALLAGLYESASVNGYADTVGEIGGYNYVAMYGTADLTRIGGSHNGASKLGLNDLLVSCPLGGDPIILNLQGGAVQTVGMAGSPAYFDMQNNGEKVQTGWATAGEGVLVYDPNQTNTVTDDANLVSGYGALDQLAGADTGRLTASDPLWSDLKVWVDSTGTGNFTSGSLYSLDQLGITSINLSSTATQIDNNGNTILAESTFTYANGSTGQIAGVNLTYDPDAIAPGTSGSSTNNSTTCCADALTQAMSAFNTGEAGADASSLTVPPPHVLAQSLAAAPLTH